MSKKRCFNTVSEIRVSHKKGLNDVADKNIVLPVFEGEEMNDGAVELHSDLTRVSVAKATSSAHTICSLAETLHLGFLLETSLLFHTPRGPVNNFIEIPEHPFIVVKYVQERRERLFWNKQTNKKTVSQNTETAVTAPKIEQNFILGKQYPVWCRAMWSEISQN